MLIAQYRGVSGVSRAIRFLTRGPYSHTALLFDRSASQAAARMTKRGGGLGRLLHTEIGSVVEAWLPEVRSVESLSAQHTPGTEVDIYGLVMPLAPWQEENLLRFLAGELGTPYNVRDVLRFVTRRPGNLDGSWFCSELAFAAFMEVGVMLLAQTQAWEVSPSLIHRSPLFKKRRTIVTVGPGDLEPDIE